MSQEENTQEENEQEENKHETTTPYNGHQNHYTTATEPEQNEKLPTQMKEQVHYTEPQWKERQSTLDNNQPEQYEPKTKYGYMNNLKEFHPTREYQNSPYGHRTKWHARVKQQIPLNKVYIERTKNSLKGVLGHKKERYVWANMHYE